MLGAYPTVAHAKQTARHSDLARYLQWEYGPSMDIAAFLAQAAEVSEKARTRNRRRFANGLRALARAFGSALVGRRSTVSTAEG